MNQRHNRRLKVQALKTLLISFLALATSIPVSGQINLEIAGYDTTVHLKMPRVYRHMRPFVGTFTFQEAPRPLDPVRVDFSLTVRNDYDSYYDVDPWDIKVLWDTKAMRLVGDSLFPWPGPHPIGAELSGSFEVIPLLSGLHGFSVYWDEPGLYDSKLDVSWCFDKDGVLSFLDRVELIGRRAPDCTQDWCTFFNEDTVYVVGQRYATPP